MHCLTETEFYEKYTIYKDLSNGKQLKTFLAIQQLSDKTPSPVIIKEINEARTEIYSVLTTVWNPYVAETYEVFMVKNSTNGEVHYFAATEYICSNGSDEECLTLAQFVEKNGIMSEKAAINVCIQLCDGLSKLHKLGIVHRDLKPENIMISKYDLEEPQVKIIDFGGAKNSSKAKLADTTVVGTLGYQAPESLSTAVTKRADIYSIGCILNYMLTGQELGLVRFNANHYIVSIIEKATNTDPSHRCKTVDDMKKLLAHELHCTFPDNIPFIRSLPGFRTHTRINEAIALAAYITMLYVAVLCFGMFGLYGFLEIFIFYIIIPLIVIFNMGNLLRFFPKNIRRDNRVFMITRTVIVILSIFAPIVVDNILVGGF